MKREAEHLDEIEEIVARLSKENKRYVLAVANALLFAQGGSRGCVEPEDDDSASQSDR